jgi:hypothetical protein
LINGIVNTRIGGLISVKGCAQSRLLKTGCHAQTIQPRLISPAWSTWRGSNLKSPPLLIAASGTCRCRGRTLRLAAPSWRRFICSLEGLNCLLEALPQGSTRGWSFLLTRTCSPLRCFRPFRGIGPLCLPGSSPLLRTWGKLNLHRLNIPAATGQTGTKLTPAYSLISPVIAVGVGCLRAVKTLLKALKNPGGFEPRKKIVEIDAVSHDSIFHPNDR